MASKQFEEKQIAVDKEPRIEKIEKDHKDQKDGPDTKHTKDHKDQKDAPDTKHKHEKEKQEKHEKDKPEKETKVETKEDLLEKAHKDQETHFAQAAQPAGIQKLPEKTINFEKPQPDVKFVKEFKHEKFEIKELKHEKLEKFEIKEHKIEKVEKLELEGIGGVNQPGGPVEQRLAALEAAIEKLMHFIPENLRPDLSQGALKQEPEAAKKTAAKTAEHKDPAKK